MNPAQRTQNHVYDIADKLEVGLKTQKQQCLSSIANPAELSISNPPHRLLTSGLEGNFLWLLKYGSQNKGWQEDVASTTTICACFKVIWASILWFVHHEYFLIVIDLK